MIGFPLIKMTLKYRFSSALWQNSGQRHKVPVINQLGAIE